MKLCKGCKEWKPPVISSSDDTHGRCNSIKFQDSNDGKPVMPDSLMYWDYECYSCGFSTGPDFGCIHWQEK